jgi:hypothetical protein
LAYVPMMAAWRASRRWTTAHNLRKKIESGEYGQWLYPIIEGTEFTRADVNAAVLLAWDVFFGREVLKYEQEMSDKNGEI